MDLSVQEGKFVRQSLVMQVIPSPNLLIKNHKTINKKGESPTRLVIPARKFTATFSKIRYLVIKIMPDKGKVNYSRFSIVQASNLREILEELRVNRYKVEIASVDAITMYPSIKLSTIKNSVRFFAIKLNAATKKTINLCLELICFVMSSTLIYFDGEY